MKNYVAADECVPNNNWKLIIWLLAVSSCELRIRTIAIETSGLRITTEI